MVPTAPAPAPTAKVWLCKDCGVPVPWVSSPLGPVAATHKAGCGLRCGLGKAHLGFHRSPRVQAHTRVGCPICDPPVCIIHYLQGPPGSPRRPPSIPVPPSRMRAMVPALVADGWRIEVRHSVQGDLIPYE